MYSFPIVLLSTVLCALPSYAVESLTLQPFSTKPFSTDGRWMTNADGVNLTYAGVNWPGHGETMVPEGLGKMSVADMVTKIKSTGMNAIRLTWAVQMVDDILDKQSDGQLGTTFVAALGEKNGTEVLNAVLDKNKSFTKETTRLEVFDAIALECARQGIYVHLDNHVSKAGWCCKKDDGNAWFGDEFFDTKKWERALGFMADHGKTWPSFVSMALRNELRPASGSPNVEVNWDTWYGNMTAGAEAIHKANPDLLIFFSGLYYDTQLRPIFNDGGFRDIDFDPSKLAYKNKIVLEVHDYDLDETNCTNKRAKLTKNSFAALGPISPDVKTVYPLVMSEWGFSQSPEQYAAPFAACLGKFLPEQRVGWMIWVLTGSYYIREGEQGKDEPWGLLDSSGTKWRCLECITKGIMPMIQNTLGVERPVATA
ncbi:MAG: hypothetical protein L6R38_003093 [Xanthoria sp. 2 TBL-2021]|nr:MAG: hypothetical protein L6R38_003093 [Xanthoria sp. 2 TBL-2021]